MLACEYPVVKELARVRGDILFVGRIEIVPDRLIDAMRCSGMTVHVVDTVSSMWSALREHSFDLVVLDLTNFAEMLALCGQIRARFGLLLILLIPEHERAGRFHALEAGADDCVFEELCGLEVLARIRSLLRRQALAHQLLERPPALTFAGWRIEPASRLLFDPLGALVALTSAEFDLLLMFCRKPGQVITRRDLLAATHVGRAGPLERSIDVHVSRLRRKIERNPRRPSMIKTVRLGGYMFSAIVGTV
ncbi:response regulator transcription factor [Rhizobium sp. BK251]|uniref:response regulator transcription factor n=1 Tax=Rhizobium sp. BK251 TaxID=2512125 RepID=UPI001404D6C0|nr:response regulator transcription factor [Rhizobium sp. BK251]